MQDITRKKGPTIINTLLNLSKCLSQFFFLQFSLDILKHAKFGLVFCFLVRQWLKPQVWRKFCESKTNKQKQANNSNKNKTMQRERGENEPHFEEVHNTAPLQKREGDWVELTFAKAFGTVTRANSRRRHSQYNDPRDNCAKFRRKSPSHHELLPLRQKVQSTAGEIRSYVQETKGYLKCLGSKWEFLQHKIYVLAWIKSLLSGQRQIYHRRLIKLFDLSSDAFVIEVSILSRRLSYD